MKTYMAKKETIGDRKWLVIDAEGRILGRLATRISDILRGKDKPTFTPHVDTGDNVIIINASKIRLTGKKLDNKIYYHHSQYPGGLKSITAADRLKKQPEGLIIDAVRRMLPKNKLSRNIIKKLKVYATETHPHAAQSPEVLSLN